MTNPIRRSLVVLGVVVGLGGGCEENPPRQAQYDFGLWCEANKLSGPAQIHFQRAVEIDKSFAPAHKKLGHVELGGRWVSYDELLDVFWRMHDPTTLNRQGPDVGSQYRSAVFTHGEDQQKAAEASKERVQDRFRRPIVTEIAPASKFWPAEEYHQRYLVKHGMASCRIPETVR